MLYLDPYHTPERRFLSGSSRPNLPISHTTSSYPCNQDDLLRSATPQRAGLKVICRQVMPKASPLLVFVIGIPQDYLELRFLKRSTVVFYQNRFLQR